jgi:hypothetical protein
MKFKSKPGRIVQKRIKRQGKWRVVPWFKFDEKGFAEVDESKITSRDLIKLKQKFKVVGVEPKSYQDLQKLYSEKTGKSAVGMKKADMLKEL